MAYPGCSTEAGMMDGDAVSEGTSAIPAALGEFIARLSWSPDRLAAERRKSLRRLLAAARDHSPWHRARLAGIDIDEITPGDLRAIPPMTKDDLIAHWDDIVTDRSITLAQVEHLLTVGSADGLLAGRYHAAASSGSSGRRGVFVQDRAGWQVFGLNTFRWAATVAKAVPGAADGPRVIIASDNPVHMSASASKTYAGAVGQLIPISLPMAEIVARLNRVQPSWVNSYASILAQLAAEARAGRLSIRPKAVVSGAEALLPSTRRAIEAAFGAKVFNMWGCSEVGTLGFSCPSGDGLHLSDDVAIVEPVDRDGAPVPPGTTGTKIYLTNLFNHLLPLIRYELTDSVTPIAAAACGCGSSFSRIEDIQGRQTEIFHYPGGLFIHPFVFNLALDSDPTVADFQVRQTERGVHVLVKPAEPPDPDAIASRVAASLARAGLARPEVTVEPVETIQRNAAGKQPRYVAMRGAA
jgi:phenylacetate-coenzyme A ligase PaaK-like adenylate-forming protein